jgi:hypothetical protein
VFKQIAEIQKAALRNLYHRIKQIAKSMSGSSEEMDVSSSLPDQMLDGPSSLCVPALQIELANGYVVDFRPSIPLGFGNALTVSVRGTLPIGLSKDVGFSFVNDEWRFGGQTLSDELIRECLTPKGPAPIY